MEGQTGLARYEPPATDPISHRRLTLEETWYELASDGFDMPYSDDGKPFIPPTIPGGEDEDGDEEDAPLGFLIYKMGHWDNNFSNLTLPRSYFGRSLIERCTFRNTDLSESRMCWNDFVDCDFTDADLHGADMRSSVWRGCQFVRANLTGADLRGTAPEDCDFTGAILDGAKLVNYEDYDWGLSEEQRRAVEWQKDDGPEAPGG